MQKSIEIEGFGIKYWKLHYRLTRLATSFEWMFVIGICGLTRSGPRTQVFGVFFLFIFSVFCLPSSKTEYQHQLPIPSNICGEDLIANNLFRDSE